MVCLSLTNIGIMFHLSKSTALLLGMSTSMQKRTEHGIFASQIVAVGIFRTKKRICKGLYNMALVCNKKNK